MMDMVEERSQLEVGPTGLPMMNLTGLDTAKLIDTRELREVASAVSTWVNNARSVGTRNSSMFERGAYTPPSNPFDEMRTARHAVRNDDIVGGVADITESFAFQGVKWESEEPDDADILNQIAKDLNLDDVLRQMWRELYTCSQFVAVKLCAWKEYKVRGRTPPPMEDEMVDETDPITGESTGKKVATGQKVPKIDPETGRPMKGQKRRKKYRCYVPVALKIIDSTKVVPVAHTALSSEYLAWLATKEEVEHFRKVRAGEVYDPMVDQLYLGVYTPDRAEKAELEALGIDTRYLLLLNPQAVFRHTLTKADYEKFADVRLKSAFALLDLKRHLIESDRATLIGAANYILLIRKGSKENPGTQEEIEHLQEHYQFLAKLPVIISDQRLEIDIIAPKTDFTLDAKRYDTLDSRLLQRLLGTLVLASTGSKETNTTLSRAVAKNMENRRHMVKRTIEREIAAFVVDNPRNYDAGFDSEPNLVFTPRNIALEIDSALIQAMMSLRTQRELSRETILEVVGLDQTTEAQRMEMEEQMFDPIFRTRIPFDGEGGAPPAVQAGAGAQGGRPQGGGKAKQNATTARGKTASGNTKKG